MGHRVILCSRNLMKGEKAATGMEGEVIVKKLDVTDVDAIRVLSEQLEEEMGHLDVLVNNSGVLNGNQSAVSSSVSDIRSVMDVNFLGAWAMIHFFHSALKKSKDARIINISSGMGAWGDLTGGHAPYRISKTALNALTLLLSNELAGSISINAVCPGWVKTDMGGASASREVQKGAETVVWLSVEENIPTGKFLRDKQVIDW